MGEEMTLMAPADSFETARGVIDSGADEIYLGLENRNFVNLNLSGRGRGCNVTTLRELVEIIEFAHERGVIVDYAVNTPFLSDELEEIFITHVMAGVDAGVDALIVGELGAMQLVREMGTGLPVHASVLLNTFNRGQIELLKSLGASKIVLPFKMELDEIRELSGCGIDLEIFGQFGCSNINGTCHLIHSAGETINLGIPCRANYLIGGGVQRVHPILDAGTDCSLCSIPDLLEIGVSALKIVGRGMNPEMIREIVQIYRACIDLALDGSDAGEIKDYALTEEPIWQLLCEQKRCKYLRTNISDSYV
jgi:putative protease